MGLDNGICIRRDSAPITALALFDDEVSKKYNYNPNVAYWRKCWNVRNIVFGLLDIDEFNDSETPMSAEDVTRIITELKKFNRNNYLDCGDCIWEWDEFKQINKRNISALKRLVRLMKKNDNIEVYFYDSW